MEQPPQTPGSSPETPQTPSMSLAGRLLNVFATPGEVFDQVKATRETPANWLVPALLIMLVGWISIWLIYSQESLVRQAKDIGARAVEKQAKAMHMPADKAEQLRASAEKMTVMSQRIAGVFGPPLAAFFSPFFFGLLVWLIGAQIHKGNFSYMKAVEAVGLGNMVEVLGAIVHALLILAMNNIFAGPNLALLIKDFDPQNGLHLLLAACNGITIWVLSLRSLALARLSGISFAKAAAWMFGLWFAWSALRLALNFAGQALVRHMGG